ncbi:MAG: NodT family efflux transporter outer membrane factor (OMF) lipoprotein [Bradymonadia bacterium]|jgi:NodT family efflux transporter outer membrane factor (OMF) lipoprotein
MRVVPLILITSLSACTVHQRRDPKDLPVEVPQAFSQTVDGATQPQRWWTAFDDAGLTAQVDRVLAQNLDIKQGALRVEQAMLRAGQAGSSKWPTLDASLGYSRTKQLNQFGRGIPGAPESFELAQYRASLEVAYEVDMFGRISSATQAAESDVKAAQYDVQALGVTLIASTADIWFMLAEQNALRALLAEQRTLNETLLELLQLRFANGLATRADVLLQQEQLERIDSQVPLVESRARVLTHQLAMLMGVPASNFSVDAPADLPELATLPSLGVPSEALKQRPDVRAAMARIDAADHRIGVAVAARYPAFRLSASAGLQSFEVGDLLDDWVWSIAGNLIAPIFDGGRLKAEQKIAEAELKVQLAELSKVMLTAIREVEDALVQERQQREHLARIDTRVKLLQSFVEDTQARSLEGVIDYLPVINAVGAVQAAQQAQLSARRQLISHRIQLHRALGGAP